MKDDTVYDMYSSQEDDDTTVDGGSDSIVIRRKGAMNELVTEHDSVLIPTPALLESMTRMITDLQRKIAILEQNSRSQTSRIFQLERSIQKLTQELDKKISYE